VSEFLVVVFVPLLMELVTQLPTGMQGLHQAGILHCDISSENVMAVNDSKTDVWIILNDFDLAGQVEAEATTARHRTGTLPFMAIELLRKAGATHRLQHDLESLFYVAVWWAVTGTNSQADRDRAAARRDSLRLWNHGTPREISRIKHEFLTERWDESRIELSPGFQGIFHILRRLKKLFVDAEQSRLERERDNEERNEKLALVQVELHEHVDTETAEDISPEEFRTALFS